MQAELACPWQRVQAATYLGRHSDQEQGILMHASDYPGGHRSTMLHFFADAMVASVQLNYDATETLFTALGP